MEAPDSADMKGLLATALGVHAVVKKVRLLYMVGRTRIHLDEVEDLGSFLEIEVVLTECEPVADGEAEAAEVREHLDISADDLVSGSYGTGIL